MMWCAAGSRFPSPPHDLGEVGECSTILPVLGHVDGGSDADELIARVGDGCWVVGADEALLDSPDVVAGHVDDGPAGAVLLQLVVLASFEAGLKDPLDRKGGGDRDECRPDEGHDCSSLSSMRWLMVSAAWFIWSIVSEYVAEVPSEK